MNWINNYLGIAWNYSGQSVQDGFNCWSFIQYILNKYFNTTISSIYINNDNYLTIVKTFKDNSEFNNWQQILNPINGCVALMSISKYPCHVGIYIKDNNNEGILHCVEKNGVIFTNFKQLELMQWKILGFYQHEAIK